MAGIALSIGVSGSGKTYGMRHRIYAAVESGLRVIALDRMREWASVPKSIATTTGAFASVEKALESDKGLMIVRTSSLMSDFEAACKWAYATYESRGIAMSEAHRVLRNSKTDLPEGPIEDCVTAWRHRNVSLWLDTPRFSLLNRTVTEQATDLRLYAVTGNLDKRTIRGEWGDDCHSAVEQCALRLGDNDPGWHVRMGVSRLGPYEPTREL